MTYLLAIQEHGVSAIIADMRETIVQNGTREGFNTALKSGILFPGVVYGIAGHALSGREFVAETRRLAASGSQNLDEQWKRVLEQARRYNDNGNHFQLLLATRVSGRSELYRYCSERRKLAPADNYTAIGSAATRVKEYLSYLKETLARGLKLHSQSPICPNHLIPAYYCLSLTEAFLGSERDDIERSHAGGLCYYVYQTSDSESCQPTTQYLICDTNQATDVVAITAHRIAFVQNALVSKHVTVLSLSEDQEMLGKALTIPSIAKVVHQSRSLSPTIVSCHPYDFPDTRTEEDRIALAYDLVSKANALEPYSFCGLGFADRLDRGVRMGHERNNSSDPVMVDLVRPFLHPQWKDTILKRLRTRRRFLGEGELSNYPVNESMLLFFHNVLGYRKSRIFSCVKSPDQCLVLCNNSHQFRIRWELDDTAVLAFCIVDPQASAKVGELVIKTDFAFVLVPSLPAGRIEFDTPISDVVEVFAKSFGVPFRTAPESESLQIYSGPLSGSPELTQDGGNCVFGFGAIELETTCVDRFIMFSEDIYLNWYRESVFPSLSQEAKATTDPAEDRSIDSWGDS